MNKQIKDLMDNGDYESALKMLLEYSDEYLAKIQCLYELKKYKQLIVFFEDIKDKIETDYYEVFGYYILSLIELKEYDSALDKLNDELSLPYIQENYLEVLNSLYDDIIALKKIHLAEFNKVNFSDSQICEILEKEIDYEILLNTINYLENTNIRNLLNSIENFLQEDRSPILKTFILEILINQQVSDVVLVKKNGFEYEFMPVANQLVFQNHNYLVVKEKIMTRLDKNPSYLKMCLDILDTLVYIIYPNVIEEDEINYYAALIEYYVFSLNFEKVDYDFESFYCCSLDDIIKEIDVIINLFNQEERYSNIDDRNKLY